MDSNFIIVLFKNKVKKKIINKFKTFKKAENYYKSLLNKSENVIFEKKIENTISCKHEIALLEKNGVENIMYNTDELGRSIKVVLEDPQYVIRKINNYKIEEKIFDISRNKKITVTEFIKNFLSENSTRMVSSLNNKIIIQDNENINLFSLKDSNEAHRFIDVLNEYLISINKNTVIFVKDVDSSQRSYIYKILEEKGFDKKMLYRSKTTHRFRSK